MHTRQTHTHAHAADTCIRGRHTHAHTKTLTLTCYRRPEHVLSSSLKTTLSWSMNWNSCKKRSKRFWPLSIIPRKAKLNNSSRRELQDPRFVFYPLPILLGLLWKSWVAPNLRIERETGKWRACDSRWRLTTVILTMICRWNKCCHKSKKSWSRERRKSTPKALNCRVCPGSWKNPRYEAPPLCSLAHLYLCIFL